MSHGTEQGDRLICEPSNLLAFPAERRIGKVRDVAKKFAARPTDKAKKHYWSQVMGPFYARFEHLGFSEKEIDRQARNFCTAVEQELSRLSQFGQCDENDGAA